MLHLDFRLPIVFAQKLVSYHSLEIVLCIVHLLLDVGFAVVLEYVAVHSVICVLIFQSDFRHITPRIKVVAPTETYGLFVPLPDLEHHMGFVGTMPLYCETYHDQHLDNPEGRHLL